MTFWERFKAGAKEGSDTYLNAVQILCSDGKDNDEAEENIKDE